MSDTIEGVSGPGKSRAIQVLAEKAEDETRAVWPVDGKQSIAEPNGWFVWSTRNPDDIQTDPGRCPSCGSSK